MYIYIHIHIYIKITLLCKQQNLQRQKHCTTSVTACSLWLLSKQDGHQKPTLSDRARMSNVDLVWMYVSSSGLVQRRLYPGSSPLVLDCAASRWAPQWIYHSLTTSSKLIQLKLWQPGHPASHLFCIMTSRGQSKSLLHPPCYDFTAGLVCLRVVPAVFGLRSSIVLPCLWLAVPKYSFSHF